MFRPNIKGSTIWAETKHKSRKTKERSMSLDEKIAEANRLGITYGQYVARGERE